MLGVTGDGFLVTWSLCSCRGCLSVFPFFGITSSPGWTASSAPAPCACPVGPQISL